MAKGKIVGFLLLVGCRSAPPYDAEGELVGRLRRSAGVVSTALAEARERAAATRTRHFVRFHQDARQAQVWVHRDSDGNGVFDALRDERVWGERLERGVHFFGIEPLPSETQAPWVGVGPAGRLELPREIEKADEEAFHRNFREGRGAVLGDVVLYGWTYVQGKVVKVFYCLLLEPERAAIREEGVLRLDE